MPARVRIGVVGCGLIAQVMHLPYLSELSDRFEIAALCDLSEPVAERCAERYNVTRTHTEWEDMLRGSLDAVMILTPGNHAPIAIAAAEAGLHVFVEKPMAFSSDGCEQMVHAAEANRVQLMVGTMKRYDPAVEAMLDALPGSAGDLRYVSVVVNDPEFEPFFEPGEIVRGDDVPRELIDRTRRAESEQVEQAVGSGGEDVVRAFSESFLGSLLHDLSVVHGMLERLGEPLPARVVAGDWWNEGRAVYGAMRLQNGARVDGTWIQVLETFEYRETIQFMFADEVHSLEFPSPWLKQHPTVYRRSRRDGRTVDVRIVNAYDEAFRRELLHFHDCIVDGTPCRTPPEGARLDIEVLTQMFLAASR